MKEIFKKYSLTITAASLGSVAATQKSCQDWVKQTIVFIVDSFYCFVSIVSSSIVSIQLD